MLSSTIPASIPFGVACSSCAAILLAPDAQQQIVVCVELAALVHLAIPHHPKGTGLCGVDLFSKSDNNRCELLHGHTLREVGYVFDHQAVKTPRFLSLNGRSSFATLVFLLERRRFYGDVRNDVLEEGEADVGHDAKGSHPGGRLAAAFFDEELNVPLGVGEQPEVSRLEDLGGRNINAVFVDRRVLAERVTKVGDEEFHLEFAKSVNHSLVSDANDEVALVQRILTAR